jgi:hypothetical protein
LEGVENLLVEFRVMESCFRTTAVGDEFANDRDWELWDSEGADRVPDANAGDSDIKGNETAVFAGFEIFGVSMLS